jgi:hypothetical protein
MADITDVDEEIVMRKRPEKLDKSDKNDKTKESKVTITDEDEDPQAKIAELLNNPEKFKAMMGDMNMDSDKMKNVMRDVTSNPETMKAARQMLGATNDEDLRDKLRKSMAKDGKQPTMKEMRKKQKEYKKIMNANKTKIDDSRPTINCVKIDHNRNIDFVKIKVNSEGKLDMPSESQPGFERIGSLGVFYDPTKVNCENRVIKRIFGRNFGREVTIYSLESNPLYADEKSLKDLALRELPKIEHTDTNLDKLAEEYKDLIEE